MSVSGLAPPHSARLNVKRDLLRPKSIPKETGQRVLLELNPYAAQKEPIWLMQVKENIVVIQALYIKFV